MNRQQDFVTDGKLYRSVDWQLVPPVLQGIYCGILIEIDCLDEAECLRGTGPVRAECPGAAEVLTAEYERRIARQPRLSIALFAYQRQQRCLRGYFLADSFDRCLKVGVQ